MVELKTLNDGRRVVAKHYKGELSAKQYANHKSANKAIEKLRSEFPADAILKVTGFRPFYVTLIEWSDLFEQCCEDFRNEIVALAHAHGKEVKQVYLWWREYSERVGGEGGQSALIFEFKKWYAEKLGPVNVRWIRERQVCAKEQGDWKAWQRYEDLVPTRSDYAGHTTQAIDQHNEGHVRSLLALSDEELANRGVTRLGLESALARF